MKFVTVRDFRSKPAELWAELRKKQELIITHNGKPIGLLTPISDVNFEETLAAIRQAMAIQSVHNLRLQAKKKGLEGLTPKEIAHEIKEVRKSRHIS